MKLLASLRIALRALRVNRMRSALTMLGIIIGVAAVIAMVAVGSGATARIEQQIQSIGSNIIIVMSGSLTNGGMRLGSGAALTLTEDDAKAIATEAPAVAAVAPTVRSGAQVMFGRNRRGVVVGRVGQVVIDNMIHLAVAQHLPATRAEVGQLRPLLTYHRPRVR